MNLTLTQIDQFYRATHIYGYKELYFLKDLFLVPFFLFLIFFYLKKSRKNQPEALQPYYLLGFGVKLLAIPLFMFHHTFIYTGGVDSFTYFWNGSEVVHLFFINPSLVFKILFSSYKEFNSNNLNFVMYDFIFAPNESFTVKWVTLINLLTGNSFLVTSIISSFFTYLGVWKILLILQKLYPGHAKLLSYSTIFIPSVIFWTSVISKEVFCIGAMGFFFYHIIELLEKRGNKLVHIFALLLFGYIIIRIKIYIMLAFVGSLIFYILLQQLQKIKHPFLRLLTLPVFIIILGSVVFMASGSIQSSLQQFAFENIIDTIKTTYDYLTQEGFASSRYTLGELEPNLSGILKLAPAGINVTLFRPYLWEANKPITLIAALESLLTLLITLYVLITCRKYFLRIIFSDKIVLMCVVFAIIFSLAVGITSGNFGTLMRYKIPMMPFYFSALAIIFIKTKEFRQTTVPTNPT